MAHQDAVAEPRIPGIDFQPEEESPPATAEEAAPRRQGGPVSSYTMIEPRLKVIYGRFYKESYFSPESTIDTLNKELIAIACSLLAKCEGCLDGHIQKALEAGASKEQISEAIAIAIGINAAAVVDQTDRAAARLGLNHFPVHGRAPKPAP